MKHGSILERQIAHAALEAVSTHSGQALVRELWRQFPNSVPKDILAGMQRADYAIAAKAHRDRTAKEAEDTRQFSRRLVAAEALLWEQMATRGMRVS